MQFIVMTSLMFILILFSAQYMHNLTLASSTVHDVIKYEQYHQLMTALLSYAHVLVHENNMVWLQIAEQKELVIAAQPWPAVILLKGFIRYTRQDATSVEIVGQLYDHDTLCYEQKMMLSIKDINPLCTTSILLPS